MYQHLLHVYNICILSKILKGRQCYIIITPTVLLSIATHYVKHSSIIILYLGSCVTPLIMIFTRVLRYFEKIISFS